MFRLLLNPHARSMVIYTGAAVMGAATMLTTVASDPSMPSSAKTPSPSDPPTIVQGTGDKDLLRWYYDKLRRKQDDEERRKKVRPIVILNEFGLLQPFDQVVEDLESSEPSDQSVMERVNWQARYLRWWE